MADYRVIDPRLHTHKRLAAISDRQYRIWTFSMCGAPSLLSKGTGIYHVGTGQFQIGKDRQCHVQDELGRTDLEISLEGKGQKIGDFVRDFPDILEYDPEKDMIFCKLMFEYSTIHWLKTARGIVEGVHSDFSRFSRDTDERWWGEFTSINNIRLQEAWQEFRKASEKVRENDNKKGHKNYFAIEKTFLMLFELEKKYAIKPSNLVSVQEMEKLTAEIAKII